MIAEHRASQRRSLVAFAEGLTDWIRGADSLEAEAASLNVADLLGMWGDTMTEGKWRR